MQEPDDIRYLTRPEIDPEKWDQCLLACPNRLIYGNSYWLDQLTGGQWDALLLGDYHALMPLPWRKKWGWRYLYQPAFTQQLGVFVPGDSSLVLPGSQPLPPNLIRAFLSAARRHFRFAEIFLNYANGLSSPSPDLTYNLEVRRNFVLPLDQPYQELAAQYKKSLIASLKLASRYQLDYTDDLDISTALSTYQQGYGARTPHVDTADYRNLGALCTRLKREGRLLVRAIKDDKDKVLATAIMPKDDHRIYLLLTTSNEEGRQKAAGHFLLDNLFREWAGHPLLLDFEGSELPGVSFFYSNFGGHDQPYYFYRYNDLPWPLRLFKK
jgi:hypothetical protein